MSRRHVETCTGELDCRHCEALIDEAEYPDAYATDREMDGAAADYVYGREPALDWRHP